MTSSSSSSSTPSTMLAFDCSRNPPEEGGGGPEFALESASTTRPRLRCGRWRRRASCAGHSRRQPGAVRMRLARMRGARGAAGGTGGQAQGRDSANRVDAGAGPLSVLSAGGAALARAHDLDTALAVIVEAGAAPSARRMPRCSRRTRTATPSSCCSTLGIATTSSPATRPRWSANPDHPVHHAALDRTGSLGRRGSTSAGMPMTGAACRSWSRAPATSRRASGADVRAGQATMSSSGRGVAAGRVGRPRGGGDRARSGHVDGQHERAEWLERVALTDPLTGLANARTLARVLELEVARAQRQGTEVSVALFDVDAFRELNEAAGSRARRPCPAPIGDRARRERRSSTRWAGPAATSRARRPGSAGVHGRARIMDGSHGSRP